MLIFKTNFPCVYTDKSFATTPIDSIPEHYSVAEELPISAKQLTIT